MGKGLKNKVSWSQTSEKCAQKCIHVHLTRLKYPDVSPGLPDMGPILLIFNSWMAKYKTSGKMSPKDQFSTTVFSYICSISLAVCFYSQTRTDPWAMFRTKTVLDTIIIHCVWCFLTPTEYKYLFCSFVSVLHWQQVSELVELCYVCLFFCFKLITSR